MHRCGSFPLLSAAHSLFSIWTDFKRSEKIPGASARGWRKWILLTGPLGLRRNSPQGLNISSIRVFDQIRDPQIPITFRPLFILCCHIIFKLHVILYVTDFVYMAVSLAHPWCRVQTKWRFLLTKVCDIVHFLSGSSVNVYSDQWLEIKISIRIV